MSFPFEVDITPELTAQRKFLEDIHDAAAGMVVGFFRELQEIERRIFEPVRLVRERGELIRGAAEEVVEALEKFFRSFVGG